MFEAHFGVPMSGAVLNTLNTRLDAEAIAFMLQHGEARVLLTDREFADVVEKALAMLGARRPFSSRSTTTRRRPDIGSATWHTNPSGRR
jgi:fatty-acyl-CoA synthase